MARSFRRSVRRNSSARRKIDWQSATIGTSSGLVMSNGDCIGTWLYYPAELPDFDFTPPVVNPPNQTLVRTVVNTHAFIDEVDTIGMVISFGICVYENADAAALLDFGPLGPGIVPDPFYASSNDWLYTWNRTQATAGVNFSWFNDMNEQGVTSRAMRKLPTGSGLLGIWSVNTLDGSPQGVTLNCAAHVRMAFKTP